MAQIKTNLQYGVTGSLQTGSIAADAIDGTKIADDAINSEHLVDGGVDNAHLATGIASSKLTGALPAISGASLTNLDADSFAEDSYVNIGSMRIGFLSETLDGTASDGGNETGANSAGRYTNLHTITYTGFASNPWIYACIETDAHEPSFNCVNSDLSTTSATLKFQSGRETYIESEPIRIVVIGVAS